MKGIFLVCTHSKADRVWHIHSEIDEPGYELAKCFNKHLMFDQLLRVDLAKQRSGNVDIVGFFVDGSFRQGMNEETSVFFWQSLDGFNSFRHAPYREELNGSGESAQVLETVSPSTHLLDAVTSPTLAFRP